MAMVNVTLITTVDHNIGDDFVREGIIYLLKKVWGPIHVQLIHKHIPITTRPEWEWIYSRGCTHVLDRVPGLSGLGVTSRLDRRLGLNLKTDKILNCDLLVQCGAPVYWLHGTNSCADNEWYPPLIQRRWSLVKERVPMVNIAAGTCQPYASNGAEFERDDRTLAYIRDFHDRCKLTTVRDSLSQQVLQHAGRQAPLVPCTSLFARHESGIQPDQGRFVALNYMPYGGHYDYEGGNHSKRWEAVFREFVRKLPSGEEYIFVCHNKAEVNTVRRLFPSFPYFWSPVFKDYLKLFSSTKFGIFNRVHAAFALASFGRPSFVVGSDSRARMTDRIGLQNSWVGDITVQRLQTEVESLFYTWSSFEAKMKEGLQQTEAIYLDLLRGVMNASHGA